VISEEEVMKVNGTWVTARIIVTGTRASPWIELRSSVGHGEELRVYECDIYVPDLLAGHVRAEDMPHEMFFLLREDRRYSTHHGPPPAVAVAWERAIEGLLAWFRDCGLDLGALSAAALADARRASRAKQAARRLARGAP
jgi:hypothetical protein